MSDPALPQGVLPNTISLVFGHPDASTLPADDLRAAAEAVLRSHPARAGLAYGAEQGTPALIDYLVHKLNREEGLGLAQLRRVYRARCEATLHALERHMPAGVTWTHPRGGFFIWITLPEGMSVNLLRQAARAQGVLFVPGTGFFANGGGERNLRLAFSFAPPDEIEHGVAILAQAIRGMAAQS